MSFVAEFALSLPEPLKRLIWQERKTEVMANFPNAQERGESAMREQIMGMKPQENQFFAIVRDASGQVVIVYLVEDYQGDDLPPKTAMVRLGIAPVNDAALQAYHEQPGFVNGSDALGVLLKRLDFERCALRTWAYPAQETMLRMGLKTIDNKRLPDEPPQTGRYVDFKSMWGWD